MDADGGLRLDYEQTTQLLRTLVDVRFKLLAFVPTITGAAVGLVGRPRPAAELLGVGLLGLLATLGIFVYELRNTQLHGALVRRAAELERQLGLRSALGASGPGGLFGELPSHAVRLLGLLPVGQNHGLALVYSAAIAGWTYLAAWGAFGAVEFGEARATGAAIGAFAGLLVFAEVERVHRSSAKENSPRRQSPPA
ncbi:MAG: hypothetical protein M3377_07415 [Actinomycetota bacterium]|nr:hypothetical protein [Actinomycetota bacterium]